MKQFSFFIFSLFSFNTFFAQGLIVNEFSNGTSGFVREYIELLVIGSSGSPTANVNLAGWVIDDNNGDFSGGGSGKGIAQGHFRIKSGCYTSVPVGSLMVIYNDDDRYAGIPIDDPNDSNGDGVYIIPHTDACIEVCTTQPSTSSSTYTGSTYAASASGDWGTVGFASGGDAPQTRKPNYSFFHGFAYGSLNTSFPTFPSGGSSFLVGDGSSGSAKAYILSCGDYTAGSPFSQIGEGAGTPGAANDANNAILIANIKAGSFDYSNLSDPDNCVLTVLPASEIQLELTDYQQATGISATVSATGYDSLAIMRSTGGAAPVVLTAFALDPAQPAQTVHWLDTNAPARCYYRAMLTSPNGSQLFSEWYEQNRELPATWQFQYHDAQLTLAFSQPLAGDAQLVVFDLSGRVLGQTTVPGGVSEWELPLPPLGSGLYIVRFANECQRFVQP